MSRRSAQSSNSIIHQLSSICEIHGATTSNIDSPSNYLSLLADTDDQWGKDLLALRFLDCKKINGLLKSDLHLILAVTVVDQNLTRFLVDDESSCNILYTNTLE